MMTTGAPLFPTTTLKPEGRGAFRLPTTVRPLSYDLTISPDLKSGLFGGILLATIQVGSPAENITMNSHLLDVSKVTVDGTEVKFRLEKESERLVVTPAGGSSEFELGQRRVEVHFSGDMRNKIVGLYYSTYRNEKGEQRAMASSKFEPTYARQAYPCFDEPNMKAKYKVHILKPKDKDYIALSNYPQISEEEREDGIMVHFAETVPMSTYLSCFLVSDFKHSETTFINDGKEIPFKVYATPAQLEKTKYAGKVGKDCIEYYINYFNISYPLPKLDMVAVPDFVSGAVEHWGMITFRETALLYTPTTHSAVNKQRVTTVVAHELAHSWFGNLVTMDWWDNLWLNEGFASYIEYKGANASEPTWKMLDQFIVGDLHPVLELDATIASHPIIQPVNTPDQITEVFDTINYNKGASVLRMLEWTVGEEVFRRGVSNYLRKHAYGNAVTTDLWNELQAEVDREAGGQGKAFSVHSFMDTFTLQMGYPLIRVRYDGGQMVLTQERFLLNPDEVKGKEIKETPLGYRWNIPIRYITDKSPEQSKIIWFPYFKESVSIPLPSDTRWVKLNPGQQGYYRVTYPMEQWRLLAAEIERMASVDRTHLIEESFSLAAAGVLPYTVPLDLTQYLTKERELTPWSSAAKQLLHLWVYLRGADKEQEFKTYVRNLVEPTYNILTWNVGEDDSHLQRLTRIEVLNLACSMGHEKCLAEAKIKFENWLTTRTPLSPDLKTLIYEFGMHSANETEWNKVLGIFSEESDASEKIKLMNGLANVQDPALLSKFINLGLNESLVRRQDYFSLLSFISGNPVGTPLVWDYVRENWPKLVERFTLNERNLGKLIPSITSSFSSDLKLSEMKEFFAKYPEAGAGAAARQQAISKVENNIRWVNKYRSSVEAWLSSKLTNGNVTS